MNKQGLEQARQRHQERQRIAQAVARRARDGRESWREIDRATCPHGHAVRWLTDRVAVCDPLPSDPLLPRIWQWGGIWTTPPTVDALETALLALLAS